MSGDIRYGAPLRIQEIKAAGDGAWAVSGYVSTYDLDLGGDIIKPGAFTKTLQSGHRVKFLYSHDRAQVLGTASSLREDEKGLFGEFRISRTRLGEDIHTLLKDGAIDSFSIGYLPDDYEVDKKTGVRTLTDISLLECSLVSLPMNPQALVTNVKAADYTGMHLPELLEVYSTHRTAALARAKSMAMRRLSEGRKLSDQMMEQLEALRELALADADAFLALLTTPASEAKQDTPPVDVSVPVRTAEPTEDTPEAPGDDTPVRTVSSPDIDVSVPVRTAGQVDAHLRRARIRELRRQAGLPPVPLTPADMAMAAS